MYCKHCGKPIPDDSRFCKHCGANQGTVSSSNSGNRSNNSSKGSGFWKGVGYVLLAVVVANLVSVVLEDTSKKDTSGPVISSYSEPKSPAPVQTEAPENDYSGYIPSSWAAENRKLSNGGSCAVMEMDQTVYSCNSVDFTMSAEGNAGTTTRGDWEVHFRVGGTWKKIRTVTYGGSGEETFRIVFDTPTTFDAVCAFPKQRGNYTYSSLYYLSNADCS